jgi:hypothetical protein
MRAEIAMRGRPELKAERGECDGPQQCEVEFIAVEIAVRERAEVNLDEKDEGFRKVLARPSVRVGIVL